MVEGARLESVYSRKGIKSSNLLLSAKLNARKSSKDHFYVYVLQSLKDFSFYVGQCDDPDIRMSKHFDGMSKYTSSKRPLRLVYFEVFHSRKEALIRENKIKKMKSRKYIIELIAKWLQGD